MRKKRSRPSAPGSGEEFDAFFYTLVSTDTQEVYFTGKRQQFLIDQGYSYKVIPSLLESVGGGGELLFADREDQIDLLAAVLHVSEAEATAEDVQDDVDGLQRMKAKSEHARAIGKRVVGSMAALSGSVGVKYLEFSTTGKVGEEKGKARITGSGVRRGGGKLSKLRRT